MGVVASTNNAELLQYRQKKKDHVTLRALRLNATCSELRYVEDGKLKRPKYCTSDNVLVLTPSGECALAQTAIHLSMSGRVYLACLSGGVQVCLRLVSPVGRVSAPDIPISHTPETFPSPDISDYDFSFDECGVVMSYPRYHSPFRLTRIYPVGFTVRHYESLLNEAELWEPSTLDVFPKSLQDIVALMDTVDGFDESEVLFAKQWIAAPPGPRLPHVRDVVLSNKSLLTTLTGELTNEILSAYFALLGFHWIQYYEAPKAESLFIFSPFFYSTLLSSSKVYTFSNVRDWYKHENLLNYHRLLIPVFIPGHWLLAMLDLTACTVNTYNSRPSAEDAVIQSNLMQYMSDLIALYKQALESDKKHTARMLALPVEAWHHHAANVPVQLDDISCGVFVCKFAKDICTDGTVDCAYNANEIFQFRLEILLSIMSARIVDRNVVRTPAPC